MKNPILDVIKAFKDALDGITYNSNPVDVYSIPPNGNLSQPYIIISAPVTTELGCKNLIGHDASINIEIISQYKGNFGTPLDTETVTGLVTEAIKPTPGSVLNVANFDMITLTLSNSITDNDLYGTNRSYRKILTWSFIIDEKSVTEWILETGFWNDGGVWVDTATWID